MTPENRPSHKCIRCGSLAIRRSHGHLLDRFWSLAGYRAYRCGECRRRFHLAVQPTPRPKNEARTESRKRKKALKRRALVVYLLALLAFVIVAYVITRERG